ncbi:MAG TPA: radical SAM protein [Candidatus Sulfotelmatobacter sp.]|nr:radical SAM protein [Candidatus Sulfotelmatobacter sp.]
MDLSLFEGTEPGRAGIERLARQATPILEKRVVEYLRLEVRSILNRCTSTRVPFTWTINPYRGCEFGCRYCYARYTHEFMGMTAWEDFEEKIYVKGDAARLLAKELTPDRCRGQRIAIGTATDPYQPAERRFRITRSLLEVLALAEELHLSITTKGDLITRDLDVLRRIAMRSDLSVNFTITTLDRRLARILEHRAPTPELRLKALKAVREAGIAAGVSLAPILPDITDSRDNLEAVMAAAKAHGATHVWANLLFLKPCSQQAFFPFLERHFPHLKARYAARFGGSGFLAGPSKRRIVELVAELKAKYGFAETRSPATPEHLHEEESRQLLLLPIHPTGSAVR